MSLPADLGSYDFDRVMNYPEDPEALTVLDFSSGYKSGHVGETEWGIGKYNEKRPGMYTTPLFSNSRDIHMGIDIWAKAGEPVFSFYDGVVAYMRNNNRKGDYGPTTVIKYQLDDITLFALYGHLSIESLTMVEVGDEVERGQKIATLGEAAVNGGWEPHLHFQLSVEDPGEADMPGVVSEEDHRQALERYPDPRLVLGDLY